MIRRKLTRIEVTLDDTKELDDFFSKTTQIGISSTTTCSSTTNSKLSNLFHQKQLLLLGKKYDFNQATTEPVPDPTSSLGITRSANKQTTNSDSTTTGTASDNQATTSSNLNELEERLSFNPQPYNTSNRFNQETQ